MGRTRDGFGPFFSFWPLPRQNAARCSPRPYSSRALQLPVSSPDGLPLSARLCHVGRDLSLSPRPRRRDSGPQTPTCRLGAVEAGTASADALGPRARGLAPASLERREGLLDSRRTGNRDRLATTRLPPLCGAGSRGSVARGPMRRSVVSSGRWRGRLGPGEPRKTTRARRGGRSGRLGRRPRSRRVENGERAGFGDRPRWAARRRIPQTPASANVRVACGCRAGPASGPSGVSRVSSRRQGTSVWKPAPVVICPIASAARPRAPWIIRSGPLID